MLVTDAYGEDFHLNPNQVVLAYATSDGDGCLDLTNDTSLFVDHESYERVVAWMERQDG